MGVFRTTMHHHNPPSHQANLPSSKVSHHRQAHHRQVSFHQSPTRPPYPSGAHTTSGKPTYQQDRFLIEHTASTTLYLVADGHGEPETGHLVAEHCISRFPSLLRQQNVLPTPPPSPASAIRTAVQSLDRSAIALTTARRLYAGTTLCALLHCGPVLHVINVGDSRAVLIRVRDVSALSTDHVATHPVERERIERNGGWVCPGGMLNGYISMSRAIGDDDLKGHRNLTPFNGPSGRRFGERLFTGVADVGSFRVGGEDLAVVVASDGVWGKMGNEEVGRVVRAELARGRGATETARAVVRKAMMRGSRDNVTAVVGLLKEEREVVGMLGTAGSGRGRRVFSELGMREGKGREGKYGGLESDGTDDSSPRDLRGLVGVRSMLGRRGNSPRQRWRVRAGAERR